MYQQNESFIRIIKAVRKALPALSIMLLIGVYTVSAVAAGMFLSRLMASLGHGGTVLAYSIGAAIQATRAILVFFPQLNPSRPNFSYAGEVIAVLMGVASIAEILALVSEASLPAPVGVSLSILMLAGVGVEVFLLREIRFTTEITLFGNSEHWGNLQDYYKARKEFKMNLDKLRDAESLEAINGTSTPQQPTNQPEKVETGIMSAGVLQALAEGAALSTEDFNLVRGLVESNIGDDYLIPFIKKLGNKQPAPLELDEILTGNGRSNGKH